MECYNIDAKRLIANGVYMGEYIPNYLEYGSYQYYVDGNASGTSFTITDWTGGSTAQQEFKPTDQQISTILLQEIQKLISDYKHTELDKSTIDIINARLRDFLNGFTLSGLITSVNIDIKEQDSHTYTIYVRYLSNFTSQTIAIPLFSHSFECPFNEPSEPGLKDLTESQKRLKDLIF